MSARSEQDQARALAKAKKEAQQRAEADAVWKQVRAEEKSVHDRTAKLRALRLAREAEASPDPPAATAKRSRAASSAAPKVKRARVQTGN